MNLANRITITRITMIPIFMVVLWSSGLPYREYIATMVFLLAASTDYLDGYLARVRREVTVVGKFLDPLADKLLIATALIALLDMRLVPGWAVIIIITRDLVVTGLRTVAASKGVVLAAGRLGKWKTVSQVVAVSLLILPDTGIVIWNLPISLVALYAAVGLTLISCVDYLRSNRVLLEFD